MLRRLVSALAIIVFSSALLAVFSGQQSSALVGQWAPASLNEVANFTGHTCAIADNNVYCWGRNQLGQLGIGVTDTNNHILPERVVNALFAGKTLSKISVGGTGYACVIANNWPYCWGRNTYGQLGNGTTNDSNIPVAVVDNNGVLAGKSVTDIAAGDGHVCVIANSKPYCWGANGGGRLGNGNETPSNYPVATVVSGALNGANVTSITSGSSHTCAVGDIAGSARVYCWGDNSKGALGTNNSTNSTSPIAVTTTAGDMLAQNVQSLSRGSGNSTVCALTKLPDGKIYCWGDGSGGQIGNNSAANVLVPTAVISNGALSGKTISRVYMGNLRACALDSSGESYCWGISYTGSGSVNTVVARPDKVITTDVLSGVVIKDMGVGNSRCAIGTNNRAYCWGTNTNGELGDNSLVTRTTPVHVLAQDNVTNSNYRLYRNANSTTPGAPFAANSTPGQLDWSRQSFRMRMGIKTTQTTTTPIDIRPNDAFIKLQYAVRSSSTCSAQTTGFSDVTNNSTIAWNTNPSVSNGASIGSYTNDPIVSGPIAYQNYRSSSGSFNNNTMIANGSTGMWDFSLKDYSMANNTSYCMRLVYDSGSALESTPASYAEIKSADGDLSIGIVTATGATVSQPVFSMNTALVSSQCAAVTGTLGTSSQMFRVSNSLSTTGWSVSIAATAGPTASWVRSDSAARYDYNDSSGSPSGCNSGSDGDGIAGQLTLDPSVGAVAAKSGCSTTGISKGTSAAFSQGSLDAITLFSASSSADMGCYWDLTGVNMSQRIPAFQDSGMYSIDMTATVVAS